MRKFQPHTHTHSPLRRHSCSGPFGDLHWVSLCHWLYCGGSHQCYSYRPALSESLLLHISGCPAGVVYPSLALSAGLSTACHVPGYSVMARTTSICRRFRRGPLSRSPKPQKPYASHLVFCRSSGHLGSNQPVRNARHLRGEWVASRQEPDESEAKCLLFRHNLKQRRTRSVSQIHQPPPCDALLNHVFRICSLHAWTSIVEMWQFVSCLKPSCSEGLATWTRS